MPLKSSLRVSSVVAGLLAFCVVLLLWWAFLAEKASLENRAVLAVLISPDTKEIMFPELEIGKDGVCEPDDPPRLGRLPSDPDCSATFLSGVDRTDAVQTLKYELRRVSDVLPIAAGLLLSLLAGWFVSKQANKRSRDSEDRRRRKELEDSAG